jgi:hypothetical protein
MSTGKGAASAAPTLTAAQKRRRTTLEREIEGYAATAAAAGKALREIRDDRLYRNTHPTFELYARDRWGMGRTRAYQLIDQANTDDALSTNGGQTTKPSSERVSRELKGTAAQKRKQWNAAVKKHGPKPTAAQTRQGHQSTAAQAPKGNLPDDPMVVDWVRRQRQAGKGRDEVLALGQAEADGWPRPGVHISKGVLSTIWKLIDNGETPATTPRTVRRARQREASTRMRKIAEEYRVKNTAIQQTEKINRISLELSATLYELDLTTLAELDDKFVNRYMDSAFDNLVNLTETVELRIGDFTARASDKAVREKLAYLRNPAGRTGPEYVTACAIADTIERKHFGPRKLPQAGS